MYSADPCVLHLYHLAIFSNQHLRVEWVLRFGLCGVTLRRMQIDFISRRRQIRYTLRKRTTRNEASTNDISRKAACQIIYTCGSSIPVTIQPAKIRVLHSSVPTVIHSVRTPALVRPRVGCTAIPFERTPLSMFRLTRAPSTTNVALPKHIDVCLQHVRICPKACQRKLS